MVCNERQPPPIEVRMEPSHPHTMDNTSFALDDHVIPGLLHVPNRWTRRNAKK